MLAARIILIAITTVVVAVIALQAMALQQAMPGS